MRGGGGENRPPTSYRPALFLFLKNYISVDRPRDTRGSTAQPGRAGRCSRAGAGARRWDGPQRPGPAGEAMGLRGWPPRPASPLAKGGRAPAPGRQRLCPGRGTEGARQTRAKTAAFLGRRGPGTPSPAARAPAGEQRPPPARRSSRQRWHSFGHSVAAVLASSLSPFARRREGKVRRLRPAGMLALAALAPGRCGATVAGEGAPRRHGRPSRPRGPCVKSRPLPEFRRYLQGVCRER